VLLPVWAKAGTANSSIDAAAAVTTGHRSIKSDSAERSRAV